MNRIPISSLLAGSFLVLSIAHATEARPASPPRTPQPQFRSALCATQLEPPTPGPVIVLKPTGPSNGSYTTSWTVGGSTCDGAGTNESGKLRLDAFGAVTTFTLWKKDGTSIDLSTVAFSLVDANGYSHAIEIKKTSGGAFQWKANGHSLQVCDFATSDCMDDCQTACGLPQDFFGTFTGSGQVSGVNIPDIDYIEIEADWTNPCP